MDCFESRYSTFDSADVPPLLARADGRHLLRAFINVVDLHFKISYHDAYAHSFMQSMVDWYRQYSYKLSLVLVLRGLLLGNSY